MVLQAFDQLKHLCCLQIKLQSHRSLAFSGPTLHNTISTTVHAMAKLFVLFCSAQDCEAADIKLLSVLRALQKWQFWRNTKSIMRRFSSIWVYFNIMRYWYNVQLILGVIMWLILLYHVRLQSYSFVEITKIQSSPQLCFQQFSLSKFACVVVLGAKYKCLKKMLKHIWQCLCCKH